MYPILYSTPWFNVYSYGLMIALGYTIATFWILRIAREEGLPAETIFDMLLIQLVVGVMGSRFLFLLESGDLLSGRVGFLDFQKGGLTFYGAVISSLVFDWIYLRIKGLPFWHVMDCVGNGLMLGAAVARLGCFLNGCCHGVECSWPWGVVFSKVSAVPLHPTQIYESMACLFVFFLNQKMRRWRRNYGQGLIASLMLYGFFRFNIEFLRGDNPVHGLGMTLSQWLSLGFLAVGVVAWKIIDVTPSLRVLPKTGPDSSSK